MRETRSDGTRLPQRRLRIKVPCQLHRIVKHAAYHDDTGLGTIDDEVPRPSNGAGAGDRAIAAQPQMP